MSRFRAEKAAARVLAELNLSVPVEPSEVASAHGIVVAKDDLDENVSGVLLAEQEPVIIAVNRSHAENRQRFSVAHELGHYFLHRHSSSMFVDALPVFWRDGLSSEGVDPQEIEANAFAAALLMPKEAIRARLLRRSADPLDDEGIRRLAEEFRVSPQAMAIRLAILNAV